MWRYCATGSLLRPVREAAGLLLWSWETNNVSRVRCPFNAYITPAGCYPKTKVSTLTFFSLSFSIVRVTVPSKCKFTLGGDDVLPSVRNNPFVAIGVLFTKSDKLTLQEQGGDTEELPRVFIFFCSNPKLNTLMIGPRPPFKWGDG